MWNVSSYRYEEFLFLFDGVDRDQLPGIDYKIDQIRVIPLLAYVILFVVGTVGNVWVTCIIGCIIGRASTKAPRSVQIYILALCCCDLVILVFSLALILDLFYGEWLVESKFLCLLYLSSESLNKFCSPFLLVALSYFCYTKICHPANHSTTNQQLFQGDIGKSTLIASICVILSVIALTPVYIYGDLHFIVFENHSELIAVITKCAFEPSDPSVLTIFTIYGFVLGYAMPTIMFTCFHAAIIYRIRRQELIRRVGSHTRRTQAKFSQVTTTIMGLVLFYVACGTPYWSMMMYQALTPLEGHGQLSNIGVLVNYVIHMLPYISCTGYPILYTLMNRDIQEAYRRAVYKPGSNRNGFCLVSFFRPDKRRENSECIEDVSMLRSEDRRQTRILRIGQVSACDECML